MVFVTLADAPAEPALGPFYFDLVKVSALNASVFLSFPSNQTHITSVSVYPLILKHLEATQ